MNNLPGTPEMMALLDALKNAAQDLAAREEKLTREKKSRLDTAQKRLEQARSRLFEGSGDRADTLRGELQEQRERLEARFVQFKEKIKRAHANIRRLVLEQVAEE